MPTSTNPFHRSWILPAAARLLVAAVGISASVGCSDDGFGERYPVTGTVAYKGAPLKRGTINFIPNSPEGRAAVGMIDEGAYSMRTFTPEDGVLPGPYKISITAVDVDLSKAEAAANAANAGIDETQVVKAVKKRKHLIPTKYSSADTSGFTREVKPETNTFNFELTD